MSKTNKRKKSDKSKSGLKDKLKSKMIDKSNDKSDENEILLNSITPNINKLELSGNYTTDGLTTEHRKSKALSNDNSCCISDKSENLIKKGTANFLEYHDDLELDIKNNDDSIIGNMEKEKLMEKINTMKNQIRYNITFWDNLQHQTSPDKENNCNPNFVKNKTIHNKILHNSNFINVASDKGNLNNNLEPPMDIKNISIMSDTNPREADFLNKDLEKDMTKLDESQINRLNNINLIDSANNFKNKITEEPKEIMDMGLSKSNYKTINSNSIKINASDENKNTDKKLYSSFTLNSTNNYNANVTNYNGNIDENNAFKSVIFIKQKTFAQNLLKTDKNTFGKQTSHISCKSNSSHKNSVFTFQNNLITRDKESLEIGIGNSILEVILK